MVDSDGFANSNRLIRIMFIDPGESSGWCLAGIYWGPDAERLTSDCRSVSVGGVVHVTPGGVIIFGYGQERDKHEAYHAHELMVLCLRAARSRGGLHGVYFEDFILGRKEMQRNLLSPVRITSAVEQALYETPEVDPGLVPWMPKAKAADAKRAVNDERLKAAGCWWKNDPDNHARDATRHAILFFRKFSTNEVFRRGILKMLDASKRLADEVD